MSLQKTDFLPFVAVCELRDFLKFLHGFPPLMVRRHVLLEKSLRQKCIKLWIIKNIFPIVSAKTELFYIFETKLYLSTSVFMLFTIPQILETKVYV